VALHDANGFPTREQRPQSVRLHNLPELLGREVIERAVEVAISPRVANEYIDAAEVVLCSMSESLHILRSRYVTRETQYPVLSVLTPELVLAAAHTLLVTGAYTHVISTL